MRTPDQYYRTDLQALNEEINKRAEDISATWKDIQALERSSPCSNHSISALVNDAHEQAEELHAFRIRREYLTFQ